MPQEDTVLPRREKRRDLPSVAWREEELERVVEVEACEMPEDGWKEIRRNDGE